MSEVREVKNLLAGSKQEFETLMQIDASLSGELKLLINFNSEIYSGFVQENIVLGAPIGGLAIFEGGAGDDLLSGFFILLFLIFAFFVTKRIFSHKKKIFKGSKDLDHIKIKHVQITKNKKNKT